MFVIPQLAFLLMRLVVLITLFVVVLALALAMLAGMWHCMVTFMTIRFWFNSGRGYLVPVGFSITCNQLQHLFIAHLRLIMQITRLRCPGFWVIW